MKDIEKLTVDALFKHYRENNPGLLNTITQLRAKGVTPKQIEAAAKAKGATEFPANNIYLIAKNIKLDGVGSKEKQN